MMFSKYPIERVKFILFYNCVGGLSDSVASKGAIRAGAGELGIIPGSMGARSYIVRGLGNPESFMSCSHGAGRKMSRSKAKKKFSLDDHRRGTY